MPQRHQLRRSTTASYVPSAGDISQGELFFNINPADKKAYVKLSDNSIFEFGGSSYALLASPTFTGTPSGPTAAFGTNTTQLATTAFVQAAVFSATVGPTGNYSTYKAAVDAGEPYIFIIGNTTETASTDLSSSVVNLFFNGANVSFGTNSVTFSASNIGVNMSGEGKMSFAHTTAVDCFQPGAQTGITIDVLNVELDNSGSTANGAEFTNSANIDVRITNSTVRFPNVDSGGFSNLSNKSLFKGCDLVGSGTLCNNAINDFEASFDDCKMSGTYTGGGEAINSGGTKVGRIQRLTVETTNTLRIRTSGKVEGVRTTGSSVKITAARNNVIVKDALLVSEDIDLQDKIECVIDGVDTSGRLDMSDAGCELTKVSKSNFGSIGSIGTPNVLGSAYNEFVAVTVTTGFSVGTDLNGFTSCVVGDITTGGTGATITFSSTSSGNTAMGCKTDVIIVDNGTSVTQPNEIRANVVY
jgi:hypothetical protein